MSHPFTRIGVHLSRTISGFCCVGNKYKYKLNVRNTNSMLYIQGKELDTFKI
jgi:hypothetical protein